MSIKVKDRDPKTTDFSKQDLVINNKKGSLFYKSKLGLHKLTTSTELEQVQNDLLISDKKQYIYQSFGGNYGNNQGQHRWIRWNEAQVATYATKSTASTLLLMPFKGTLHKLFFKQSGKTTTSDLKIFKNPLQHQSHVDLNNYLENEISITNNPGNANSNFNDPVDSTFYGDMNTVNLEIPVEAGDHWGITIRPTISGGLWNLIGHLLYSQEITT